MNSSYKNKRQKSSFRGSSIKRLNDKKLPESDDYTICIPGSYESCYFGKQNIDFYRQETMGSIIPKSQFTDILERFGKKMGDCRIEFKVLNGVKKSSLIYITFFVLFVLLVISISLLSQSVVHESIPMLNASIIITLVSILLPFIFMVWNFFAKPKERTSLKDLVYKELSKYIEYLNEEFKGKISFSFNKEYCYLLLDINRISKFN